MDVRGAVETDLPTIFALEQQGFEPRQRWSEKSWSDELEADNRVVLVGDTAGQEAGSTTTGVITVQVVGGVAELIRIVVGSATRRTGVGRTLLAAGIAAARESEADEMLLEVRHDNAAALALYVAFGFEEIARRNNYYGGGVDAVVMRLELEGDDD